MYNFTTYKETQITTSGSAMDCDIYGDRIVIIPPNPDIYMYDLSTHNETQITNGSWAKYPVIYGNRIVWSDKRDGDWKIYVYDLSTKKETSIGIGRPAYRPDIYKGQNCLRKMVMVVISICIISLPLKKLR